MPASWKEARGGNSHLGVLKGRITGAKSIEHLEGGRDRGPGCGQLGTT